MYTFKYIYIYVCIQTKESYKDLALSALIACEDVGRDVECPGIIYI
jgi:hypothetical protein